MRNIIPAKKLILAFSLIIIVYVISISSGAVEPVYEPDSVIMVGKYYPMDWPDDEMTILEAEIAERDLLIITVDYCAGCREHIFKLLALPGLLESHPPGKSIVLSHDAQGDTCIIDETRVLCFDLGPLRESLGRRTELIFLHILGYHPAITYYLYD